MILSTEILTINIVLQQTSRCKENLFHSIHKNHFQLPVWYVLMSLEVPILLCKAIVNDINLLRVHSIFFSSYKTVNISYIDHLKGMLMTAV
jgi:hypothetical protein